MSKDKQPIQVPSEESNVLLSRFRDIVRQLRLAWRLFWDERISLWTKLIPPAALAYVVFPFDIVTDLAPGLGQLDDIVVLLLSLKLFIELAPPEIVREHLRALGARIEEWRVVEDEEDTTSVVEGTYRIKNPQPQESQTAEELPKQ